MKKLDFQVEEVNGFTVIAHCKDGTKRIVYDIPSDLVKILSFSCLHDSIPERNQDFTVKTDKEGNPIDSGQHVFSFNCEYQEKE